MITLVRYVHINTIIPKIRLHSWIISFRKSCNDFKSHRFVWWIPMMVWWWSSHTGKLVYGYSLAPPESREVHKMSVYSRIPIPSIFTTLFNSLSLKELIIEKMAPLSRFELFGPEMLEADPEALALFEKINSKLFF